MMMMMMMMMMIFCRRNWLHVSSSVIIWRTRAFMKLCIAGICKSITYWYLLTYLLSSIGIYLLTYLYISSFEHRVYCRLSLTSDVCLLMQRNMDAASASLLEIPPQLAYVFSKLDGKTATYFASFLLVVCFLKVVGFSTTRWLVVTKTSHQQHKQNLCMHCVNL